MNQMDKLLFEAFKSGACAVTGVWSTDEEAVEEFDLWRRDIFKITLCHCGEPVTGGYDGNPYHDRGMCADCDSVRCDAYPGECGRDNGQDSAKKISCSECGPGYNIGDEGCSHRTSTIPAGSGAVVAASNERSADKDGDSTVSGSAPKVCDCAAKDDSALSHYLYCAIWQARLQFPKFNKDF